MSEKEQITLFEAPKVKPVEFRLYYDNEGKVLFYSGQEHEGKYIVIDAHTYAEGRMDLRVLDGKIIRTQDIAVVAKVKPNTNEGVNCHVDDISIVVNEEFEYKKKWKLNIYELR